MSLRSIGRVAGWSIFLGNSWTWCIGMFLPVLMLRDLGIGGFIALAAPNVLGAAAMGWVIRSPEQSEHLIHKHQSACAWFSLITIAFHGFFTAWLIEQLAGSIAGAAVAAAFAAFWLILQWRGGGGRISAASLALLVSLLAAAWAFWRGDLPYVAHPISTTRLPEDALAWLALSCTFGFGLCPYLDLTFHAARQHLGIMEARFAFLIGFAVIFFAMLLFTLSYSGWLVVDFDRKAHPQLAMLLSAHLIVQSALTMALHVEQLSRLRIRLGTLLQFGLILIAAVFLGLVANRQVVWTSSGENIYRSFLGFYGLVFPAYVWLRVLPPARSMVRFWIVIIIAIPMFGLAFIGRQMAWLIPGVAIPLIARYLAPAPRPVGAAA